MIKLRSFVVALAAFAPAVMPTAVSASEVIAHRGVYHDTDTNETLAENSSTPWFARTIWGCAGSTSTCA